MAVSLIAPMVSSIDTTSGFFIDKCHIWKRSRESRKKTTRYISSIISITFNEASSRKKSHKSRKKI